MNENRDKGMTLEELLEKLKGLKYNSTILGKKECFDVITRSEFYQVENLIRQYALDNHDGTLGVLEAKVKTYEAIIKNSNFAPLIVKALEQEPILDKIRAEIMSKDGLEEALEIIDKYRE